MTMLVHWDKAIEELNKKDKIISKIISQYPNEKMVMKNNSLHTLVRSIVGQQISVKAADAIWNRLEKACNYKVTEKNILKFDKSELREIGLSNTKADYIFNVVNADITKNDWEGMDDDEIISKLCEIKGIGPWTAEMFLIFRLGRENILPLGDIGLVNAINLHYNNKEKFSKTELIKFKEKWRPWCSIATWYMWRSLDPIPVEY